MTGHPTPIPTWHGPVCYHRHRVQKWEGPIPGMGMLMLVCSECGASASAAYNTPMPELPPMPVDEARRLSVAREKEEK